VKKMEGEEELSLEEGRSSNPEHETQALNRPSASARGSRGQRGGGDKDPGWSVSHCICHEGQRSSMSKEREREREREKKERMGIAEIVKSRIADVKCGEAVHHCTDHDGEGYNHAGSHPGEEHVGLEGHHHCDQQSQHSDCRHEQRHA